MANLRILEVEIISSTNITARFTAALASDITIENITIVSDTVNVPDATVLSVTVIGDKLDIICQPMTEQASYTIKFTSSDLHRFKDLNGVAFLIEDDSANVRSFLGPNNPDNPFYQNLKNIFRDQIYDTENAVVVGNLFRSFATYFAKALYDLRQVRNENYLTKLIVDEQKTRGAGPFDRLAQEGAYEILRVGRFRDNYVVDGSIFLDPFPASLVSLRQETITNEDLTVASSDVVGSFNVNTFTLNLENSPVIKVDSVVFYYSTILPNGGTTFSYDLQTFGYQILDERYDPDYAFKYLTLENNQIRLSEKVLGDENFSLSNITKVRVSYKHKNLGRMIEPTTVTVTQSVSVVREVTEPLLNIFNLGHAPILSGEIVATFGAVSFLDPNSFPSLSDSHPAFANELKFSFEALPNKIGDYSVDYETGTVYVFGADSSNDGTGAYPPLASYTYRKTYRALVDYVYDSDEQDVVAIVDRDLIGDAATISFTYEDVLVPNVDYKAQVHQEALLERIENRYSPNVGSLEVSNGPITNVFRVFNETQGVVYSVSRWSNNKIYFQSANPPRIDNVTAERVTFQPVLNDLLFVNEELENASNVRIFRILLSNNNIIAATEDCIGASFNTSLFMSDANIFETEIYFEPDLTVDVNINLLTIGQYQVDYQDGVIYVAVSAGQEYELGTASYKRSYIEPQKSHVLNPLSIYNRRDIFHPKDHEFAYSSFGEGFILPSSFDFAGEQTLDNDSDYPYQVYSGVVGTFIDAVFTPGVTSNIKALRYIFEYTDLKNNPSPVNFADFSSFLDKSVTIGSYTNSSLQTVEQDGSDFYVNAGMGLEYLSANITLGVSVVRLSDGASLWDGTGSFQLGTPFRLQLPNVNGVADGDNVTVTITLSINDTSRVVVDYNRGDLFIDYTYLADEIVVSYEYGDNVLDFRESETISEGTNYFVTYRVGALRDALLRNFGTLINIPLLNVFDGNFERERYREAIIAAMSSFIEGPTIQAMSRIIETITHVKPEIIETIFQNWSLGSSSLYPVGVTTTGTLEMMKGKFGNGALIANADETISFPMSSNLSLNQGTFSAWIIPQWKGIDNDAELTFTITKDGYALDLREVYIGAAEQHPNYPFDEEKFTVSRADVISPYGKPNKNHPGVYVYLAQDGYGIDGYSESIGQFDRWFVDVIGASSSEQYKVTIDTNGEYYDVKAASTLAASTVLRSGNKQIKFNCSGVHQAIGFVADINHYVLDCGNDLKRNRISIFKDASGFLNFRVIDIAGNRNTVSADVGSWVQNEPHHVAASWILDSSDERDEIHLFVDGFEAVNIERYGDKISPAYGRELRQINPEEIVSVVTKNIVSGIDMTTTAGSAIVSASTSFSGLDILAGATLFIEESGFDSNGYNVVSVDGNELTLGTVMPATLTDAAFSVNKISIPVSTKVNAYPNVVVTLIHPFYTETDGSTSGATLTSGSTLFSVIGTDLGDLIRIEDDEFDDHYTVTEVSGNTVTVDRAFPSGSGLIFYVYRNEEEEIPGKRALYPAYQFDTDGYGDVLVLKDQAETGDLVLVKSLGLNFKRVRQNYYLWSDTSNIIRTRLPAPLSLDDVDIKKILLSPTNVKYTASVNFNLTYDTDNVSLSDTGRSLSVTVSGSNIDWTTPVTVTIGTDVLVFTENGTQDSPSKHTDVQTVNITGKSLDATKTVLSLGITEKHTITTAEDSDTVPVIRFSYQVRYGAVSDPAYEGVDGYGGLESAGGDTVTDPDGLFSAIDIGNYVHIFSGPAAGYYPIIAVSTDHKSATIDGTVPAFFGTTYEIINVTVERSGLQNGYFTFDLLNTPKQPYLLTKGMYSFDYESYISMKFAPVKGSCFIGSDLSGANQVNAIIDEVKISNVMLTDTRIGEEVGAREQSITKEFNALKQSIPDSTTLMLMRFEETIPTNVAKFYSSSQNAYIQGSSSVNDNFGQSIILKEKPLIVPNTGIIDTNRQGTIEFWVSPTVDTYNDPNHRFYFDAAGIVTEEVISSNSGTITLSGRATSILSVKLKVGNKAEEYSGACSIAEDTQTIQLKRNLPHQETPVVVSYVPVGFQGDRISIYKDPYGYINFNVRAAGIDYQVRSPVFWAKNTWHRLKATYTINGGNHLDQIKFFVDGYERGNILMGQGLLFGSNLIFGQAFVGETNIISDIRFSDIINQFTIGADYAGNFVGFCKIDNLRISNVARPAYSAFGESVDVNYNSNISTVVPVTEDLYTTYLLDFDSFKTLNTDFALLKNKNFGLFDFSLNIFDSFGIVKGSDKVKEVLETLIRTLKPANSRVFIKYL